MRPHSITMFDRFYLGSLALGTVNFFIGYDTTMAQLNADPGSAELGMAGPGFLWGTFAIGMAISLLLWFLISRKANNVARWILVVLAVIGVIGLPFSLTQLPPLQLVASLVVTAINLLAVYFLFRPDAKAWFEHGPKGMDPDVFE
jgi:asparagine N-glycosylation enzyme membrane subunit Stt3